VTTHPFPAFPAGSGLFIRPNVQTRIKWAQPAIFDPSRNLYSSASEIIKNPHGIEVWTLGRIGSEYPSGKKGIADAQGWSAPDVAQSERT
jgi:hypothetical protein